MHIQTPLRSLPATAGSHVQRAILSQAPRMKRHISASAQIELRGGERVGITLDIDGCYGPCMDDGDGMGGAGEPLIR